MLFSGATVVLALVGMFLVPQTIFRSIAAGAIAVVLVSVLAALTLLPAALAVLGDRIERLRRAAARRAAEAAASGRASPPSRCAGRRSSLVAGVARARRAGGPVRRRSTPARRASATLPGVLPDPRGVRRDRGRVRAAGHRDGRGRRQGERTPRAARAPSRGCGRSVAGDPAYGETSVDGRARRRRDARHRRRSTATPSGRRRSARRERCASATSRAPSPASGAEALVRRADAPTSSTSPTSPTTSQPLVFAFVLGLSFLVLVARVPLDRDPADRDRDEPPSVGAAYGLLVLVFQHGVGADLLGFQQADDGRVVAAAVPVHDPVRALDGLPRVPAQPDPRALAGDGRHARERRVRRPHDRAADHRRGADHGRGVRRVRRAASS